jgi:capsid protein
MESELAIPGLLKVLEYTDNNVLDKEVEDYLNIEVFPNCDVTGRYDFFKMLEFGIMGCNRGGDYGWAFQRIGIESGMESDDIAKLPLRLQAVEPDRIGGIYQNVVSDDYVSGCIIGKYGEIEAFRVFRRSMTTSLYDNPVDVPASDFIHFTDPMRIDQYRGVSVLATAIQDCRDLYEMKDFVKGKAKLASALTVFTNSNGATTGSGAADPYATTLPGTASQVLQQDILFGQINHLPAGSEIKFPASNSPSQDEYRLMMLMLKFVAMSYNLPFSFAIDAAELGGVSARLESELAKAEFERIQRAIAPHAHRMKNAFLIDACAKGIFPIEKLRQIMKGRFGFRPHPQPDIGKEASASVSLWQNGLLNPIKYWQENAQDPETVADEMSRWQKIKEAAAERHGVQVQSTFGNGPAQPTSVSQSTSETVEADESKAFGRHDAEISQLTESIRVARERRAWAKMRIAELQEKGEDFSPSLVERLRKEIDQIDAKITQDKNRRARLRGNNDDIQKPTESPEAVAAKKKERSDRYALTKALMATGKDEDEAFSIAYKIIGSGKFDKSRVPSEFYKDEE